MAQHSAACALSSKGDSLDIVVAPGATLAMLHMTAERATNAPPPAQFLTSIAAAVDVLAGTAEVLERECAALEAEVGSNMQRVEAYVEKKGEEDGDTALKAAALLSSKKQKLKELVSDGG